MSKIETRKVAFFCNELNLVTRKVGVFTIGSEELFLPDVRKPLKGYKASEMRSKYKIYYWEELRSAIFTHALSYIVSECIRGVTFHYVRSKHLQVIELNLEHKYLSLNFTTIRGLLETKYRADIIPILNTKDTFLKETSLIQSLKDIAIHVLKKYTDIPLDAIQLVIQAGLKQMDRCNKSNLKYYLKVKLKNKVYNLANRNLVYSKWEYARRDIVRGFKAKFNLRLKYRPNRIKKKFIGLSETQYLMYIANDDPNIIPEGYASLSYELLLYARNNYAIMLCDFNIKKSFQKVTNYAIDNPKFIFEGDVDGCDSISST